MELHSKISVCGSRTSGRYLSAQQPFLLGDVIARFSAQVLLALPTRATYTTTCHGCFRRVHQLQPAQNAQEPAPAEPSLKPCTGCRGAWYCSKDCQRTGWRAGHRVECKVLKRVTGNQQQREERILPTPTRALLSVAASEDKWREVSEKLVGNEDKWRDNKQAWGDMELQGRMVRSLLGVDPKWVGQGEAEVVERYASVLCKISTNSFNVTDLDLGNDSIFLDTTLAMANHSCIPNASAQIFGSNACLVAERPIAKDEEITISYIDLSLPLSDRQKSLASYHFSCTCRRCKDDLTIYQICSESPALEANEFSLACDVGALREPAIVDRCLVTGATEQHAKARDAIAALQKSLTLLDTPFGPVKPVELLRKEFNVCKPFIEGGAWVYVSTFLQDCLAYYAYRGQPLEQLCISSLLATHVYPFLYPNPHSPQRLKSTMAIVARLPEVTVDTARYTLHLADLAKRTNTLEKEQLQELQDIDTVMANRMMLFMILSYAMSCHVSEWPFWDEVKNAYMFVRADKLWPDVASRRAIEMWENMQPPEAFSPTWKAMVQKYVHRFAGMGMRLIPLDFGSL